MLFYVIISMLLPVLEDHDLHLSVTEINAEGDQMEVVTKIFFDDLQMAMGLNPGDVLPDNYTSADEMIQQYIMDHLVIKVNDIQLTLELSESVALLPAVWTTFKVTDYAFTDEVEFSIENRIMNSLFDDQTNIVKIYFEDKRKDITFSGKKITDKVRF